MTHIVQDLLTLSRFDSGRDDLKLARFSFSAAVQDLYNAVYMEAQRHSHTLKLEMPQQLPQVTADRERIVQVMIERGLQFHQIYPRRRTHHHFGRPAGGPGVDAGGRRRHRHPRRRPAPHL